MGGGVCCWGIFEVGGGGGEGSERTLEMKEAFCEEGRLN